MTTQGLSLVIPPGAALSSTLMQGAGLLQGPSVVENMAWREIGFTVAVLVGAWLIRPAWRSR